MSRIAEANLASTDTAITRPLAADEARLIAAFWRMTPLGQERFLAFTRRVAEGDAEARGLAELGATGKITREQLLQMLEAKDLQ